MAFQVMYRLLSEGVEPPESVRLAPHVVMRSNLRLFLERLRSLQDGVLPVSPALMAATWPPQASSPLASRAQSASPLPSTIRR
jgi:hypothetical protein